MNQLILVLVMFLTVGLSHGLALAEEAPTKPVETAVQAAKADAGSEDAILEDEADDQEESADELEKAPANEVVPGPAAGEDVKKGTM